jgi:ectoine hydroxylase-related dioxygenase (phytanoyl-CoA dioxygenase family)
MTALLDTLADPFTLTASQIASYRRDGFIKLKDVLDAATLAHYGAAITAYVAAKAKDIQPLAERGTYGKAFQQISNIWPHDEVVREFVFAPRLARIAAELMEVRGVRMYHDQALFKEPGGGFTPWHADQQYWPLPTAKCVTAWIPLQATPVEMGPLQFAIGSQRCAFGRDLAISDESERLIAGNLRDLPKDETPYDLGEVSFHAGWSFHRAGPNNTATMRGVMTVIYMDIDMQLASPRNPNQEGDARVWCPGVEVGQVIDSPLNPVMWER